MIKPFRSKTFEDLVRQMNEFEKEQKVFATNLFPPTPFSELWYGASFYNPQIKEDAKSSKPEDGKVMTSTSDNSPSLKLASDKQKSLLLKLGWKGNINKLTKFEAFKLLNEYFGK